MAATTAAAVIAAMETACLRRVGLGKKEKNSIRHLLRMDVDVLSYAGAVAV